MRNFKGKTTTTPELKNYATSAGLTVQELGPVEINKHVLKLYDGDVCLACFRLLGASTNRQGGVNLNTAIYDNYWIRQQEVVS